MNELISESTDVVVIGGGPAGSTAAGFLAKAGLRVVLFERERFPRYHIGESLLSATMPLLDALGVTPEIEKAGFVRKPGGTFLWGRLGEPWSFFFREDPGGLPHAYHVLRSEFDHILLRHASGLGVDVREGWKVTECRYDGTNRVEARDETGKQVTIESAYVVDASGQRALLGQRDGLREFNPFFKNLAIFGYFEGAEQLTGATAGNILSAAFPEGWFWYIPLHNGTTSVGAVVDARRYAGAIRTASDANERAPGRSDKGGEGAISADAEPLYRRLIEACPEIARRLSAARLVSPVRVIRDYSYCSQRFYGPGYLLAGDAACFIDPVFSTGVHLACLSGYLAANAISAIFDGSEPTDALAEFDSRYRGAFERYLQFLCFFYDHHSDPDSYFWTARKVLNPDDNLEARTAFVRLMSGGADLGETASVLASRLADRHARLERATARGRFGATPEAEIFRVKGTLTTLGKR